MIFRLGGLFCGPSGLACGARMAGEVRGADGGAFCQARFPLAVLSEKSIGYRPHVVE